MASYPNSERTFARFLKDEDKEGMVKTVMGQPKMFLSLKFFLKDHKPEMPLRVVINKNGTWKMVVSKFLQRGLGLVPLEKSLTLRNSEELIRILSVNHGRNCSVLSMDIKDLYYSLEKKRLMNAGREFLELNLVKFQSESGISVEGFLTILDLYLQSTVLELEGQTYVQKEGVCIGSSVAPILAEIYLNTMEELCMTK